jgi:hypothetical protein
MAMNVNYLWLDKMNNVTFGRVLFYYQINFRLVITIFILRMELGKFRDFKINMVHKIMLF